MKTYIVADFHRLDAWHYDGHVVAFGSLSDVPDPSTELLLEDTPEVRARLEADDNCREWHAVPAGAVDYGGDPPLFIETPF